MTYNTTQNPSCRATRINYVRMEGLEPPRLAAPDPKSGAATNYATSAYPLNSLPFQVIATGFVKGAQIYRLFGNSEV